MMRANGKKRWSRVVVFATAILATGMAAWWWLGKSEPK
jgi:multidrug resistance efflux pump